jgi:hypothetical protein
MAKGSGDHAILPLHGQINFEKQELPGVRKEKPWRYN